MISAVLTTALAPRPATAPLETICVRAVRASTAHRVYAVACRREGTANLAAVGRRDRGADGRADRAGLVRQRRRNSTIPSKTRSGASRASLEPPALRIGCDRPTSGPDNATALGRGLATRGLPAGRPGEPTTTWQQ